MVCAGQKQSIFAPHSLKACQHVGQCIVERVPHVEFTCDVGRWHDDAKRFFFGRRFGVKRARFEPHIVKWALFFIRFKRFWDLFDTSHVTLTFLYFHHRLIQ